MVKPSSFIKCKQTSKPISDAASSVNKSKYLTHARQSGISSINGSKEKSTCLINKYLEEVSLEEELKKTPRKSDKDKESLTP